LKSLPMNVIYISRNATKLEGTTEIEIPSLKEKHQNIVNGNCDLSIQCKKVGKNYIRVAKARRKDYMRDQVDDDTILGILDTITGVFGRTAKTTKKKQDEIVKQLEQKRQHQLIKRHLKWNQQKQRVFNVVSNQKFKRQQKNKTKNILKRGI